jgi:hypothetical protein
MGKEVGWDGNCYSRKPEPVQMHEGTDDVVTSNSLAILEFREARLGPRGQSLQPGNKPSD